MVLYFYPKDDTTGCTLEGNQFTALVNEFSALNTVILGVSKASSESHQAFINKYNYQISLLADTAGELCEAYAVWQEKEKNGVKKMGIVRSTFIIDKAGVLQHAEYGVVADGHAAEMLKLVESI
jgi:peroxiredoxin